MIDFLKNNLIFFVWMALGMIIFIMGGVEPSEVDIYKELGIAIITAGAVSYFSSLFAANKVQNDQNEFAKKQDRLIELLEKQGYEKPLK